MENSEHLYSELIKIIKRKEKEKEDAFYLPLELDLPLPELPPEVDITSIREPGEQNDGQRGVVVIDL